MLLSIIFYLFWNISQESQRQSSLLSGQQHRLRLIYGQQMLSSSAMLLLTSHKTMYALRRRARQPCQNNGISISQKINANIFILFQALHEGENL